MNAIDLAGFDAKFARDPDPWATFVNRDEAIKRQAIQHALGCRALGRTLELASGNGSNSVMLAQRSLRLDATEGSAAGVALTATALRHLRRGRALQLVLPGRFPRPAYDAVVIAELLYYLSPRDMKAVAQSVVRSLVPSGTLVLAHHRIDFYDFSQHAAGIHGRFLRATGRSWRVTTTKRTSRWIVDAARLCAA